MEANSDSEPLDWCGGHIRPTYMHEYGGYVWQPTHPDLGWRGTPEPYVHLAEAKAFLRGVETAFLIRGKR